ncbi:hypothetical protein ABVT39_021569 [Epinephelus coioides]
MLRDCWSPDSPYSVEVNHRLLASIDARLKKLDILDELCQDVQELKQTSEFICAALDEYKKKTDTLKTKVAKLETTVNVMKSENGQMKEKMLQMTSRPMRGIPETPGEDAETTLRQFFIKELRMDVEMVKTIQFDHVHRIQRSREHQEKPCLLVAKFVRFKDKAVVKSFSKRLAGKPFGMNNQFPPEIVARRRKLIPKLKEHRENKDVVRLAVDKLYINGRMFKDKEITPWLFSLKLDN